MSAARRTGRILRACLAEQDGTGSRDELAALAAGSDLSGLPDAARYHRVIGYAYQALKEVNGVDSQTVSLLGGLYRQGRLGRLRVVGALDRARAVLEPLGVPWLVVKGPVLDEVVYRRPGLRLYHDLDLVVPRSSFAETLEALEASGFGVVDRNWDLMRRLMIGEVVLSLRGGPELDLHWDLLYDREFRRILRVPVDELVARARVVEVGGEPVRTLDPVDTLVHLAMHACKQGGDRLVWLKDIERSIATEAPDWADVVGRSTEWRVQLFVGTMLARARRTVSAQVPDEVLRALLPNRAWRSVLTTLDRVFPAERSTGFGTPATLVVRATRPDVRSTLVTAVGGVARRGGRLLRGRSTRDEAQDDPEDPASRAFPTGGDEGRSLYLREILDEP